MESAHFCRALRVGDLRYLRLRGPGFSCAAIATDSTQSIRKNFSPRSGDRSAAGELDLSALAAAGHILSSLQTGEFGFG